MNYLLLLFGTAAVGAILLFPLWAFVNHFSAFGEKCSPGAAVFRHLMVGVAVWPLAVGVSWVVVYLSNEVAEAVRAFVGTGLLPKSMATLAMHVGSVPPDVTFLDVASVACLLYVAYGLVLVQRRLVDIVRLLKLSMNRLTTADPVLEAEYERVFKRKNEEAAAKLATGGGRSTGAPLAKAVRR